MFLETSNRIAGMRDRNFLDYGGVVRGYVRLGTDTKFLAVRTLSPCQRYATSTPFGFGTE